MPQLSRRLYKHQWGRKVAWPASAARAPVLNAASRGTSARISAARFTFPGRLAQLGERQLDKLEVTGSSPVTPIKNRATEPNFGQWFEPTFSTFETATRLPGSLRVEPAGSA